MENCFFEKIVDEGMFATYLTKYLVTVYKNTRDDNELFIKSTIDRNMSNPLKAIEKKL